MSRLFKIICSGMLFGASATFTVRLAVHMYKDHKAKKMITVNTEEPKKEVKESSERQHDVEDKAEPVKRETVFTSEERLSTGARDVEMYTAYNGSADAPAMSIDISEPPVPEVVPAGLELIPPILLDPTPVTITIAGAEMYFGDPVIDGFARVSLSWYQGNEVLVDNDTAEELFLRRTPVIDALYDYCADEISNHERDPKMEWDDVHYLCAPEIKLLVEITFYEAPWKA